MPEHLLPVGVGMPLWLSSIDNRITFLFSFDHGISTKRMEWGSAFVCVDVDGAKISDNDVGDSIDLVGRFFALGSTCWW